jgi:peptidoglycan/LPS O-acetylase OafA/YrhL
VQIRSGYLATLDGWRAIAVLFVIFYHDGLRSFGPLSTQWIQDHGVLGVDIFFGISGLLICSRMLDEESTEGSISLKKFYIRRAFRIFPPALFYLIVLAILGFLGILPVLPKEWFASLFSTATTPCSAAPPDTWTGLPRTSGPFPSRNIST